MALGKLHSEFPGNSHATQMGQIVPFCTRARQRALARLCHERSRKAASEIEERPDRKDGILRLLDNLLCT